MTESIVAPVNKQQVIAISNECNQTRRTSKDPSRLTCERTATDRFNNDTGTTLKKLRKYCMMLSAVNAGGICNKATQMKSDDRQTTSETNQSTAFRQLSQQNQNISAWSSFHLPNTTESIDRQNLRFDAFTSWP